MNTYPNIICKLICLVSLLAFVGGCADQSTPAEPRVIRKKIVAKRPSKAPGKTAPQKIAKAPVAAKPKSDIAREKPPAAPQAGGKVVAGTKAAMPKELKPKAAVAKTPVAIKERLMAKARIDRESTPEGASSTGPAKLLPAARPASPPPITARPMIIPKAGPLPDSRTAEIEKKATTGQKGKPQTYSPAGKTDPFKPPFKEKPAVAKRGKKRKKRVPRTPLERVALSQLKLTAIIMAPSGNRAMVRESSGKGYVIKKGTYIGLNSGKVENITKDRVIIAEEVEDSLGKVRTQKRQLVLPKPAGDR